MNKGMPKDFIAVYKSELAMNGGKFKEMVLPTSYIDYGDHTRSILIELFVNNTYIGYKELTLSELLSNELTKVNIGDFNMYLSAKEEDYVYKSFV